MVGATPVFCEIDILSYHMSLDSIKRMYSDKVRAIVYPHLFGNMSDTKEILEFCKEKNIAFIEDMNSITRCKSKWRQGRINRWIYQH